MSAAVCAIVRDEAPFLLEWIAWQNLLGFDRILVYDNQSRDGSTDMLAALARAGVLIHVHWPDQPGVPTQAAAYADALRRAGTAWTAFLDVDEFLLLHGHGTVGAFLLPFPPRISAVAVNQAVFGSAGQLRPDGRLVTQRFTRRGPGDLYFNRWVKSIVRTAEVARPGNHVCTMRSGMYADPSGNWARRLGENQFRIHRGVAQVNHYILKSAAEFARKAGRGSLVSAPPGGTPGHNRYTPEFFANHDRNEVEDLAVAARSADLHREIVRLSQVAGL